jgi:Glycosyl hydrolase family 20, domain 2
MAKKFPLLAVFLLLAAPRLWAAPAEAPVPFPGMMDLSGAVIVTAKDPGKIEQKAAQVLQEEIQKRTGIELKFVTQWPDSGVPVIAVGTRTQAGEFAGPFAAEVAAAASPGPEGFSLASKSEPRTAIVICGNDGRGAFHGVGRLLRKMQLRPQSVLAPEKLEITTAPKFSLRGDQLGYRPKVNAYDAWSPAQFDQYIRELALFGANSIEILPPRTDDQKTSPLMKLPPMEMMERLSEIIDSYGLDVWVWYPNMGKDYTSEAAIQKELAEREEVFRRLKRIDHILVPGGDPGNLHPDVFFPWMDRMAVLLQKYHPNAKIWVSPQAFDPTKEWLDSFYRHVNQKPPWLGGVAFAPWIATPLPEMRAIVDRSIKIRNYPDITHNLDCQYPVPNWDLAFALTLHRECYNPRPVAMKTIHNLFADYTCGSLCYSEGINDDVNKFVWLDQDWDPSTSVMETLRDYCRLFIGPDLVDETAQGFLALEKNWDGPLAVNRQVDVTLEQWRDLEKVASPGAKERYRFQMGLLRAYYDAYVKRRLIHETELEAEAMEALRLDENQGTYAAMEKAESILRKAETEPVAIGYKGKCEMLADSLFEKIGSQTSVKRHGAQNRTRGAFMDGIDEPLNNAAWLRAQFQTIRSLPDESSRWAAIGEILNRTNPGPGGFYDSLGDVSSRRRIVNLIPWKDDPGTLKSPRITFYYEIDRADDRDIPLAWKKQADTLYGTPLRLAYDHLDPHAAYSVRATYSGRTSRRMRLMANDRYLISDQIEVRKPPMQEFPIPREATASGHLELEWSSGEGERSCEVAEVWLIKNGGDTMRK